jgi:SpoVK/Ycf46/Vps4 family AAA+-type ATPase
MKEGMTNYKFKSLNVFSSEEWMINSSKKYRTVYDRAETTYIWAEFSFYNKLFDEEEWTAKVNLKAFSLVGNDKTELCNLESGQPIGIDVNIVVVRDGWGNENPGTFWFKGDYVWEAYIDGELVGSTRFHVEDAGKVTVAQNPYFELISLKVYPGPFDRIDESERRYLKRFKRDETTYIWTELTIKNKTNSDWFYEFFFNIYDDSGQAKTSIISPGYIKINTADTEYTVLEGWGTEKPGSWKDDAYSVEIVFMDTLIAAVTFEVGNEDIEGSVEVQRTPFHEISGQPVSPAMPEETMESVLKNLEELIGLSSVKQKIKEHIKYIDFLKLRKEKGFEENEKINLHSVFTGNPGTGKTTVVNLLGKIYQKMGLLSKGHVIEADRSALVGEYIGQTAPKVKKMIDAARGGILFIDEAYMLARKGDDDKDFGKEVIEVIIKEMSDGKGDIAIMVAGYPAEMNNFLDSNPGLKSRFSYYFHFDDYLPEELLQIAEFACEKKKVTLSEDAKQEIEKRLVEAYRNRDKSFGNARYAISIVDEGKMNLGLRLMNLPDIKDLTSDVLSNITLEDIQNVFVNQQKKRLDLKVDSRLLCECLDELNSLTGMENCKEEVNELVKLVKYYRESGKGILNRFSLHSIFIGNPGTGKTTLARLMGKIYKALGLLERGHVIEADRERMVAAYVGQTAIKTKELIDQAKGGVLFIDEAYALSEGGGNDFGREAIEVILKNMEDMRGELAVIVAGYPDNMNQFLESNPGLKSRFNKTFVFSDFTAEQLYQIALQMLTIENLTPDEAAQEHLKQYFTSLVATKDKFFGNARTVRNTIEETVKNQQLRMADTPLAKRSQQMMETMTLQDVEEFLIVDSNAGSAGSIGFKRSNSGG